MEVVAGACAGDSATSGSTSTGSFSPDGLSAACSAIPPDQRAVGQPLRRCSSSACWISLHCSPSGASPAAPSQTTRRTGIILEEEEAGLDGISALGPGSSLQVCRVPLYFPYFFGPPCNVQRCV
jgi:hypothetical protein